MNNKQSHYDVNTYYDVYTHGGFTQKYINSLHIDSNNKMHIFGNILCQAYKTHDIATVKLLNGYTIISNFDFLQTMLATNYDDKLNDLLICNAIKFNKGGLLLDKAYKLCKKKTCKKKTQMIYWDVYYDFFKQCLESNKICPMLQTLEKIVLNKDDKTMEYYFKNNIGSTNFLLLDVMIANNYMIEEKYIDYSQFIVGNAYHLNYLSSIEQSKYNYMCVKIIGEGIIYRQALYFLKRRHLMHLIHINKKFINDVYVGGKSNANYNKISLYTLYCNVTFENIMMNYGLTHVNNHSLEKFVEIVNKLIKHSLYDVKYDKIHLMPMFARQLIYNFVVVIKIISTKMKQIFPKPIILIIIDFLLNNK